MTYAAVPGGFVRYDLRGPPGAPAVVLCGSLGSDLGMWDQQIPALARRHRVLRYDCRGHGASTVTPGPCTIDRLARDVLALLDGMDIARASVCGLSMGGQVGLWLGIYAAERVDRLVLANTGAQIGSREGWDARIAAVQRGGVAAVADGILDRWLSEPYRSAHPDQVAWLRGMLLRTPAAGYAACCAAVRDCDLRGAAAEVRAPTLVVAGALDAATPPADARALAGRIRGASYLELPAAHLSNVESAERFTAALLQHLDA